MRLIPSVGDYLSWLVVALAAAALLSLVLTPVVRRFAIRLDNIDQPEARRVNDAPVPRGGGIAVAASFLIVAVVGILVNSATGAVPVPSSLDDSELAGLLVGGAVATVIGVLDDTFQLRARWQLLGQLALAGLAVIAGVTVFTIANPFGPGNIVLTGPYAVGFTVVWIVGMINSINFIDGLDGLSSGIALIAAATLGVISFTTAASGGQPFIGILCFALAGSLLGFLRWNFHPASIFIGTSGVMFVGYTLAVLSILGTAKVAVALLVLGVPIIDTFWIIIRRVSQGRSPFSADRGHLHHRLLDLGLSHRQAVMVIYAIGVILAISGLLLSGRGQISVFLLVVIVGGLLLFLLTRRAGDSLERESYADEPEPVALGAIRRAGEEIVGAEDDASYEDATAASADEAESTDAASPK
jgi:UDP-GlcNAc:undecaprenyl-phosphate GlcNAc-1-phosphate transferase